MSFPSAGILSRKRILLAVQTSAKHAAVPASPTLGKAGRYRVRAAAMVVDIATAAFVLLAAWPGLVWRLRFGSRMG